MLGTKKYIKYYAVASRKQKLKKMALLKIFSIVFL